MVTWTRPLRAGGWATIAMVAMLGLGACGNAAEDGSAGSSVGAGAGDGDPAMSENSLKITVEDGAGAVTSWTLTCDDPPGGTHPDPAAACAALTAHEKSLEPVPADAVCTMQYGGDDTATVVGAWKGEKVNASFNLSGGCEIARWTSLVPLLPAVEGSGGAKSVVP